MTPQIFLVPKKVDSLSHKYGDKELKNITRFLFSMNFKEMTALDEFSQGCPQPHF